MAAMKDCPSCGIEVPVSAKRCKACFHDFDEVPLKSTAGGPIFLLISLAGMVVVAVITLLYIVSQPRASQVFVDQGSRSITWTETYVNGNTSDRLMFDDIQRIEHVKHSDSQFELIAITNTGERKSIKLGDSKMDGEADKFSKMMDRPWSQVDLSAR